MATAKTQFTNGLTAQHMTMGFFSHHLATDGTDNLAAMRTHAARNPQPSTNTVILDALGFKQSLANGAWTDRGNSWEVVTNGAVQVQSTTKRSGALPAPDAAPTLLTWTGAGGDAGRFSVSGGTITAVEGATSNEVTAARAQLGAYPTGTSAHKKAQRRDYRTNLVARINDARRAAHRASLLLWAQTNFAQVSGTAIYGNAAMNSMAAINGIASFGRTITVHVRKSDGVIYHLQSMV